MKRSVTFALTAATLCVAAQHASAQEQDPKKQAKKAAEAFCKALLAEDLDAAMKLVDVPWFMDGKSVVKEKAEIRALFEGAIKRGRDEILKITKVHVSEEDVEEAMLVDGDEQKEMLKSVTKEGDLAVIVMFETKSHGEEGTAFLIRPGKDGAKIIGISG